MASGSELFDRDTLKNSHTPPLWCLTDAFDSKLTPAQISATAYPLCGSGAGYRTAHSDRFRKWAEASTMASGAGL